MQRIDSPGNGKLTINAAQYGKPLAGARIVLDGLGAQSGWGIGDPTTPDQPKATIPDTCTPADGLSYPSSVTTDAQGRVDIVIEAKLGYESPRGYLDGQIYVVNYRIDGEPPNAHQPLLEVIVVHARNSYAVPAKPAWIPDIAPIFIQYGNLYPIMSQRLVDLSNPDSVTRNLKVLQLAFSLDVADPNYMPVTRDLSANKHLAVRRWLDRLEKEGDPTFVGGPRLRSELIAGAETAAAKVAANAIAPLGKMTFVRSLKCNRDAQGKN